MHVFSRSPAMPLRQALTVVLASAFAVASSLAVAQSLPTRYTATVVAPNAKSCGKKCLNERGQVAGDVNVNGATHAFLYDGSTLRDLGTLGGNSSRTIAINNNGQVVGNSDMADGTFHAFVTNGTTMRDLGTLGGPSSRANAINDRGQVAGTSDTDGQDGIEMAVFLFDGTTMRNLGTTGGTRAAAYAINNSGQITGWSYVRDNNGARSNDNGQLFLYDGTTMRDLGPQAGIRSYGYDINDRGQITGYAYGVPTVANRYAFVADGTTVRSLGTLGASSFGEAINANGQVIGSYNMDPTAGMSGSGAFFHDGTTMRDVGTLGGSYSITSALNDAGQVVGSSMTPSSGLHAYVWTSAGGMVDLNSRLANAPAGLVLRNATAISNSGYIVAQTDTDVVLLTPVASDSNNNGSTPGEPSNPPATGNGGGNSTPTQPSTPPTTGNGGNGSTPTQPSTPPTTGNSGSGSTPTQPSTPPATGNGGGSSTPAQPSTPPTAGNGGGSSTSSQPSTPPASGSGGGSSTPTQPSTPPATAGGGGSSVPSQATIPVLAGTVTASAPVVLNMSAGSGPTVLPGVVSQLSGVLGTQLSLVGQSAGGTVVLQGANGTNLAFAPITFQGSDGRPNGVYPAGNGQYTVVVSGNALTITPAVVALDQLSNLLPGAAINVNDKGGLTATVGSTTYTVQPDVFVTSGKTGNAQVLIGSDGIPRFTDASGNTQKLNPAFADTGAVQNAARSLDANAQVTVELDGSITLVLNGQRYSLVPDLTLDPVPANRQGQSFWQEGGNRFRLSNGQPAGTTQGFTVK